MGIYLQGPENEFSDTLKILAGKKSLLGKRIFFLKAVDHDSLVEAATKADVGIIPYQPEVGMNNKFCCPGKLSQYMVAGLPIIANELPYVADILSQAECGYTVNFHNKEDFVNQINLLASNKALRVKLGKNARKFFRDYFNWDNLSADIITKICKSTNSQSVRVNVNEVITRIINNLSEVDKAIQLTSSANTIMDTVNTLPTPTYTIIRHKPWFVINRKFFNVGNIVLTKLILFPFPLKAQEKIKNVLKKVITVSDSTLTNVASIKKNIEDK